MGFSFSALGTWQGTARDLNFTRLTQTTPHEDYNSPLLLHHFATVAIFQSM